MSIYNSLIFDLGKVVFDLSFDRVFQSWSISSGKHFNDIKNKFEFDTLFDKFEKDEIAASQFRSMVSQRLSINLSDIDFDNGWCNLYMDVYNGIDDLLINLKRNYKLVALTNTNIIHHNVWPVKYAHVLVHFEKIFSSHEMGARKPEAEAYKIVLDHLQCKPSEVIFLDDNADNIRGAKEIGIETIWVTSQEDMIKELQKFGCTQLYSEK
jgi:glucose-1-phosphatase